MGQTRSGEKALTLSGKHFCQVGSFEQIFRGKDLFEVDGVVGEGCLLCDNALVQHRRVYPKRHLLFGIVVVVS